MKEKKYGVKSYGGIGEKYLEEIDEVMCGAIILPMVVSEFIKKLRSDDGDFDEILSEWLNGPYEMMRKLKQNVADLESKIMADPQFSDKIKQKFFDETIHRVKDCISMARDLDDYFMNGAIGLNKRPSKG